MKKILCPTDFSDTSLSAITYAAEFVQHTGGELTLLNVAPLSSMTDAAFPGGNQVTVKAAAERLESQCEEVRRLYGIQCKAQVAPTYDNLGNTIGEQSAAHELIVMGTNGPDDLRQFFLGTNTYNTFTAVSTPVLIVPEGVSYHEIRNITYAFDYLSTRMLPLDPLRQFAGMVGAQITVLQVMEEAISLEANEDLRELQFILQAKYEDCPLNFETIRSSDVARSIDQHVAKTKPDMLAVCSRDRNFLERLFHRSVLKILTAIGSYPIFAFKA